MPMPHENRRTLPSRMRGALVRDGLLSGCRRDEVASCEDQTPTGRGGNAAPAGGCTDGMAQASVEMTAIRHDQQRAERIRGEVRAEKMGRAA